MVAVAKGISFDHCCYNSNVEANGIQWFYAGSQLETWSMTCVHSLLFTCFCWYDVRGGAWRTVALIFSVPPGVSSEAGGLGVVHNCVPVK